MFQKVYLCTVALRLRIFNRFIAGMLSLSILSLSTLLFTASAMADEQTMGITQATEAKQASLQAASEWLAMVDQGLYEQSWHQASIMIQERLTADQWRYALEQARQPFGDLLSREVTSQQAHQSLPGIPDGRYQVIVSDVVYEHKRQAIETITLAEIDAQWQVVGYYIR